MSNADERPVTASGEWDRLDRAVRRALDDRDTWRRRAILAEKRVRELESTLRDVSSGRLDPLQLSEQAQALERENRLLLSRLTQARETVERILVRLQFVEEER
jgi:hypothetical protein